MKCAFGMAKLPVAQEALSLADWLCQRNALPPKALSDARHVALAAVCGVDYLLTWNCKHIANMETLPLIQAACFERGYSAPRICTPIELLGAN